MKVEASAGRFDFSVYTDGWPLWVDFKIDGDQQTTVRHDDLEDMIFAAQRLLAKIKEQRSPIRAQFESECG